jgi:hypothetical protein
VSCAVENRIFNGDKESGVSSDIAEVADLRAALLLRLLSFSFLAFAFLLLA